MTLRRITIGALLYDYMDHPNVPTSHFYFDPGNILYFLMTDKEGMLDLSFAENPNNSPTRVSANMADIATALEKMIPAGRFGITACLTPEFNGWNVDPTEVVVNLTYLKEVYGLEASTNKQWPSGLEGDSNPDGPIVGVMVLTSVGTEHHFKTNLSIGELRQQISAVFAKGDPQCLISVEPQRPQQIRKDLPDNPDIKPHSVA